MTLRPLFLLSDFGLADPYVGIMKAVILGLAPGAPVVDLTHLVPPQSVLAGALAIEDSWPWLPPESVLCAVVDPGVGGERAALAARVDGRFLVGPDNGLFSPVLESASERTLVRLRPGGPVDPSRSATFHGRDVFAPGAALLARGEQLASLGEPTDDYVRLEIPRPRSPLHGRLELQVLAADHFGNLALNLKADEARAAWPWLLEEPVAIRCAGRTIHSIARTFSDVATGQLVVYWNSAGRLEIGLSGGSAARELGCGPGTHVHIDRRLHEPPMEE